MWRMKGLSLSNSAVFPISGGQENVARLRNTPFQPKRVGSSLSYLPSLWAQKRRLFASPSLAVCKPLQLCVFG